MSYEGKTRADRVGVGSWILTMILLAIPIVNVIYFIYLILGFGLQPKVSLARAFLILYIIGFAISFVILFVIVGSMDGVIEEIKNFFTLLIDSIKGIGGNQ